MLPPLTILLASVLKPLDDTRMLGKFGRTLAGGRPTQVHVAGRWAPRPAQLPPNLYTHALLHGSRLSLARLLAQGRYWQLLRRLRPQVVVVHAPELLPLTVLWQLWSPGCRFVYDVRENYALNIQTQAVYPAWARGLLAGLVRHLESQAARRASAVLLAERSYAEELPFAAKVRTLILENKYQPYDGAPPPYPRRLPAVSEPLRLLYSGTISELNGVWEAIRFALHLREAWPQAHLTIIGACQQPGLLARLQAAVEAAPQALTLRGGPELVPHAEVVAEIRRSHVGLLPYRPHPSTARCVPTKLFEYQANALPVVLPPNPLWVPLVTDAEAGIVFDFQQSDYPSAPGLAWQLQNALFYSAGPPSGALWSSEAGKLLHLMDSIG
ncbi:glycosyltransferase [Hymenobacter endophyticus]|uniref:Glycosyltransferase n=1 Tax=Hymenobacter endophyticus TaxID=3076335 RepID=A0ABU3TFP0_9BACT|nr:glycosyltransferase [Hymenobacter endophyticus]MDU0370189.1 glycosyltransferase [Hymenobacter endophyticus]